MLIAHIAEHMAPIQDRRKNFESREDELSDILREGAKKARECAGQTMEEVYRVIGMPRRR
jgi:tryptophanyl-tRNA synthetase